VSGCFGKDMNGISGRRESGKNWNREYSKQGKDLKTGDRYIFSASF